MPLAASNTIAIIGITSVAVILWLFCAFSAANTARSNGQSYNAWLLAGLVGGPVTWLFGALYFRFAGERSVRARHSERGQADLPEIIRCTSCGQSVPSSFKTCQFCGQPLHSRKRR